jgi:hypothetical protein
MCPYDWYYTLWVLYLCGCYSFAVTLTSFLPAKKASVPPYTLQNTHTYTPMHTYTHRENAHTLIIMQTQTYQ